MATYKQIGYGSKGSDVTELQKLLNQNGYNLSTDGIYGAKTQAAVKDYQKKNSLAVDGIAGNDTWGALTKAQSSAPSASTPAETAPAPAETKAPTFEYGAYKPSDTVAQAEALLQQQIAQKPGAYQSTWEGQLNDTIAQILNRDKFSYDLNGDMLYQQYADQYRTQGKLAMMDTMGQAAAMTGGYGNSYAQTAGQQAYQGYLQQLNDVVPELYGMALDQYNQQGQDLYNQAALMAQQEDQDYGRYMDQLTTYYTELGMAQDEARYQAEQDYGKWADDRNFAYGQYSDDRAYDYQAGRDAVADEQWQKQYDEQVRQYNQQYALQAGKSSGSGGSGGSGGGGGYGSNYKAPDGWNTEKIKEFQRSQGLAVDGIWGPNTQKAYENYINGSATTAEAVLNEMVKTGTIAQGKTVNLGTREGQTQLKSAITKEINNALKAGAITEEEARKLKETYLPKGYTY